MPPGKGCGIRYVTTHPDNYQLNYGSCINHVQMLPDIYTNVMTILGKRVATCMHIYVRTLTIKTFMH